MLYELRMYRAGPGRVGEIEARMRDLVPPLFARHGFPVPHAEWVVTSGPRMPMYVWLLSWPDPAERARAFASLYADTAWADLRAKTNGPREMVLKYDNSLMHAAPAWEAAKALHADQTGLANGVHELRIYEMFPGKGGQVNQTLADTDLPALKAAGGTTLGLFDVQAGPVNPALVHVIHWPDHDTRERGWDKWAADPAVIAARKAEVEEVNTYLLGQFDSWLMRPTAFRVPNHGFA